MAGIDLTGRATLVEEQRVQVVKTLQEILGRKADLSAGVSLKPKPRPETEQAGTVTESPVPPERPELISAPAAPSMAPINVPMGGGGGAVSAPSGDTSTQPTEQPQVKSYNGGNLLEFISKGEGDYNTSNRGTIGDDIVGSTNNTQRNSKALTSMTLGEIQQYQNISDANNPDRLFAVGRYQVIPSTLNEAIEGLGLSSDTVFNEETQDKIGFWLIGGKRPTVGRFLSGGDVSVDNAMLELAKEFASIPVPFDTVDRKGNPLKAGQSYYHNEGGNRAQHSVEETRSILLSSREGAELEQGN